MNNIIINPYFIIFSFIQVTYITKNFSLFMRTFSQKSPNYIFNMKLLVFSQLLLVVTSSFTSFLDFTRVLFHYLPFSNNLITYSFRCQTVFPLDVRVIILQKSVFQYLNSLKAHTRFNTLRNVLSIGKNLLTSKKFMYVLSIF